VAWASVLSPEVAATTKGADQNRTGVRGFAGLCLTTRPRRRRARIVASGFRRNRWCGPTVVPTSTAHRRPECTSVADSSRSSSSSCSLPGSSETTFSGRPVGRPLSKLAAPVRGRFYACGDEHTARSRADRRAVPALQRRDGVAPRNLAVPALPIQARLLRGRIARAVPTRLTRPTATRRSPRGTRARPACRGGRPRLDRCSPSSPQT
jgi:hypothetical protein